MYHVLLILEKLGLEEKKEKKYLLPM